MPQECVEQFVSSLLWIQWIIISNFSVYKMSVNEIHADNFRKSNDLNDNIIQVNGICLLGN